RSGAASSAASPIAVSAAGGVVASAAGISASEAAMAGGGGRMPDSTSLPRRQRPMPSSELKQLTTDGPVNTPTMTARVTAAAPMVRARGFFGAVSASLSSRTVAAKILLRRLP